MSTQPIPNEILTSIIEQVAREDLLSLCLCSHRLRSLTEPLLYSTIPRTEHRTITKLIRTIASRPDIIKHVKNLRAGDRFDHRNLDGITEEAQQANLRGYMPDDILGSELCGQWNAELFCKSDYEEEYLGGMQQWPCYFLFSHPWKQLRQSGTLRP
jgi:hypothetical protein